MRRISILFCDIPADLGACLATQGDTTVLVISEHLTTDERVALKTELLTADLFGFEVSFQRLSVA